MKSWLRNDRVYQSTMNGALLVVFLAALSTGRWPQFDWVAGSITVIAVLIAAAVYMTAGCGSDNEKHRPEDHVSAPQKKQEVTEPMQQYAVEFLKKQKMQRLLNERLWQQQIRAEAIARDANKQFQMLYAKWLEAFQPVAMRETAIRKAHVRADTMDTLVVTVGSVKIEIQEQETKIYITSSKTIVVMDEINTENETASDKIESLAAAWTKPSTISRTVH